MLLRKFFLLTAGCSTDILPLVVEAFGGWDVEVTKHKKEMSHRAIKLLVVCKIYGADPFDQCMEKLWRSLRNGNTDEGKETSTRNEKGFQLGKK